MVIIISVIIFLFIVLCIFAGYYMFNIAINTTVFKKQILGNLQILQNDNICEERKKKGEWLEKNSEIKFIEIPKNLRLCGYIIRNKIKSNIWVIAVHGYMGGGTDMMSCVQQFLKMGYNGLIIDQRGHGNSQGIYRGMGYLECKDLKKWIEMIIEENKEAKIILYGVSMGATTVMMATGENLPNNVKVCIEDCGYTSVWEEFKVLYKKMFRLPTFPILQIASIFSKIKAGYSFKEASAIKAVQNSQIPIMFIHGEKDNIVPYSMAKRLYNIAQCEKELIIVPNAKHTESCNINMELYWNRVKNFIEKHI